MNQPQFTPPFPPHIKPVRVGVYLVGRFNAPFDPKDRAQRFAFWNGRRWSAYRSSVADAQRHRGIAAAYQAKHWRGLAERPKGGAL